MSDASEYVKLKLQSDKILANSLDQGTLAFGYGLRNAANTLYSGFERLTWTTSCLIPQYQDDCSLLKNEDERMFTCISEFLSRADAILDMLVLCIDYVLSQYTDNARNKILNEVMQVTERCHYSESVHSTNRTHSPDSESSLAAEENFLSAIINECNLSAAEIGQFSVMSVTGVLAGMRTRFFARQTLAYAIAKKVANSVSLTKRVRASINQYAAWGVLLLEGYGVTHQASLSARHLELLNKDCYDLLYENKLEMFFFLIEDYLPAEFYNPHLLISSQNELIRFLKGIIL